MSSGSRNSRGTGGPHAARPCAASDDATRQASSSAITSRSLRVLGEVAGRVAQVPEVVGADAVPAEPPGVAPRVPRHHGRPRGADRVDVVHLPRAVMQEGERPRLHEHVVVIRRAAHEGGADRGHLVADAEAEPLDEEAARGGCVGRGRHHVRELARPRPLGEATAAVERAFVRTVRPGPFVASCAEAFCTRRGSTRSVTRTPVAGSVATSEASLRAAAMPSLASEAAARPRSSASSTPTVSARSARRGAADECELLAAVAADEAAGRDLGEPELAVEGARRGERRLGDADLDVGQAVQGHQLSLAKSAAALSRSMARWVAGSFARYPSSWPVKYATAGAGA